ncbi:hypothetical protein [Vreelandella alkaliphila]|uniref:Uncharacterized protein n=1 Tax=Vreelandella alkaliphila TaxID=272774 RepID=A0AAJ2S0M0_9GAMM|nr:hypothetical protein [Halomonas alkaliphila]MDX5979556.1 hypothetical protein [Halomonas alkaliphila]
MKASRDLQIKTNIVLGKIPFKTFYDKQDDYKASGLSPDRFRETVLLPLAERFEPAGYKAMMQQAQDEKLNSSHIDTLLRATIKDVFGDRQWAAFKHSGGVQ